MLYVYRPGHTPVITAPGPLVALLDAGPCTVPSRSSGVRLVSLVVDGMHLASEAEVVQVASTSVVMDVSPSWCYSRNRLSRGLQPGPASGFVLAAVARWKEAAAALPTWITSGHLFNILIPQSRPGILGEIIRLPL